MKPRALKPGDTVGLVTPASPLGLEKIAFLIQLLEEEGYRVQLGAHAFDRDDYLAGSDEARAADLMWAFTDPTIDAVICNRGGYGAARLFPYLDLDVMAASGKIFAGFSDITTLHLALLRRGLPVLHAPMGITLVRERARWVYDSLRRALCGEDPIPAEATKGTCLVPGIAEGSVTGGCLCLICDSLGTPDSIDCHGKIVIIEDVDENPHRVDAMLTHLINAGQIQHAAGIVIGEMSGTDERLDEGIGAKPWRTIVQDRLGGLGIPLIVDFPFGHAPQMLSLPLGIRALLDAEAGTLTYLESLCA
ncbi:MAG: S66 peptidase family protein [Fimbriimonas sp.]